MFIYLSKKIAIPHGIKVESLAWNRNQGWISCGGGNGLLKVLKLETQQGIDPRTRGVAAPSNLSMNQTLEGHSDAVTVCTWNPTFRKLTTSDSSGLIIVWMMHKGMWFEEMINNRNKSTVKDMKWTPNGQKICIAYADGAVIVGSVDGNRLWGKDLNLKLKFVEWSPDSRTLLFGTMSGEVHLYDNSGNKISQLPLLAVEDGSPEAADMIAIDWYDGTKVFSKPSTPALAIAFKCGKVQISRSTSDHDPILVDTGMELTQCKWSWDGSVLALAGCSISMLPTGEEKRISTVQFYTPHGQHLRSLKVPGPGIAALTWEGSGLRIALAVESFIYFANIRPDYKWGYFCKTLCYAFPKSDRPDDCVVFWDMHTDDRYTKYIKNLITIKSAGENCVLATQKEIDSNRIALEDNECDEYVLTLCNSIGAPVDSKTVTVNPLHVCMTQYHVIVADNNQVYVWQYRSPASKLTSLDGSQIHTGAVLPGTGFGATSNSSRIEPIVRRKEGRERLFHVDDMNDIGDDISKTAGKRRGSSSHKRNVSVVETQDRIACITADEKCLIVARESGTIHRYTLPHISLEAKYMVPFRPQQMALNCESGVLGIIDIHCVQTSLDLESSTKLPDGKTQQGKQLPGERKDTWDILWAQDNPKLFAVMEKTRMYVLRESQAEEPLLSSGYLCEYKDLKIKAVMLDEIMKNPHNPDFDCVIEYETKSLRDARELLSTVGLEEVFEYIASHPHPRLWQLVAEAALEQLSFGVAERAFVQSADYAGIQLVKRLGVLNDKLKQKAEVAAYFQRFDEAEALYREIDRKDLAIELRTRLGDWFRVVQLVQTGGGDDKLLNVAYNHIGDYYAERQKWSKAVQYYVSAKNADALVDCYYALEEYDSMEKLIRVIPEGSKLLHDIGDKFRSVGMSKKACSAYLKAGDVKAAIDCCVLLNHWEDAVDLAQEHEFPQIEGLLAKYASYLLHRGDTLQAIELYRKAKKSTQAATLLSRLAQDVNQTVIDPLRAKKLHVLAAMEVEEMRIRTLDLQMKNLTTKAGQTVAQTTAATLESLMQHDAATGEHRALDNGWKGAEAYHYFMLTHRQLYEGQNVEAFLTSLKLVEYEDILDPKDIYSLVAISSYLNKAWGQCSKAFIELESLKTITPSQRQEYADLAIAIFSKHAPVDPPKLAKLASKCGKGVTTCVASGKPIASQSSSSARVFKCKRCSRRMYEQHLNHTNHCPLCHHMLV